MPRVRVRSPQGEAFLTVDGAGACIDADAVLRAAVGLPRDALRALIARNGWTATIVKEPPPATAWTPGDHPLAHPTVRAILGAWPDAEVTVTPKAPPLLDDAA